MFEGSFMEAQTGAKEIDLKFDDSFITPDSLDSVLASFYSFEINLTKQNIHRILATARYLQCEEIVQKCQKMLTKLVNRTVSFSQIFFNFLKCSSKRLPELSDCVLFRIKVLIAAARVVHL